MRALKAENDEGFHVSMHLCMWSEKQPDILKIKVILLCETS